ncbi:hypothetical protein [Qipengyuania nanhaisediminis]|uniref:hypothetical protein n=1 Tax=Qipengyuania nanhaisediminis TaxID=604088 RepID=UPI0038B3C447
MKKTNFASMLAVAGGLAVATAACSAPADDDATDADMMSVEEAEDMADEAAEEAAEDVAEAACEAADEAGCCAAEHCCAASCDAA